MAGDTMLTDLTLNAVRAESLRAHLKHHRPDEGSGSLFDDGLTILARLAALLEEVGELAEELLPAASVSDDVRLFDLIEGAQVLGDVARRLTYDHGGPSGLVGPGTSLTELLPSVNKINLVKELIQTANVCLTWAQQLETPS